MLYLFKNQTATFWHSSGPFFLLSGMDWPQATGSVHYVPPQSDTPLTPPPLTLALRSTKFLHVVCILESGPAFRFFQIKAFGRYHLAFLSSPIRQARLNHFQDFLSWSYSKIAPYPFVPYAVIGFLLSTIFRRQSLWPHAYLGPSNFLPHREYL